MSLGTEIVVRPFGTLTFDENFVNTGDATIYCNKNVSFGRDCLLGWDTIIMDTDHHHMVVGEKIKENSKPIEIGNHCWITSNVKILKGTKIPNNCVIGCGSVVTKQFSEENCLIINNNIQKKNIDWRS